MICKPYHTFLGFIKESVGGPCRVMDVGDDGGGVNGHPVELVRLGGFFVSASSITPGKDSFVKTFFPV